MKMITQQFNSLLKKHVTANYQKEIFQIAWNDFTHSENAEHFFKEIRELFLSKVGRPHARYVRKVKCLLMLIEAGMQLFIKLNTNQLPKNWSRIEKDLILLTCYNFIVTLPCLLIIEATETHPTSSLRALQWINHLHQRIFSNESYIISKKDYHQLVSLLLKGK